MLASSLIFTAGYITMGEWLKTHAVAIILAGVTGVSSFTGGQVLIENRFTSLEGRVDIVEGIADKYVPIVEHNSDSILVIKRDYNELYKLTAAAVAVSNENASNIKLLLEDRNLLQELSKGMHELSSDVRVVKNEVSHIREGLDELKE